MREFGGDISQTYGVPLEEIQEGIKNDVRQVIMDTNLKLASTAAIRKHLSNNISKCDPKKIILIALETVGSKYENGGLNQIVHQMIHNLVFHYL